MVSEQFANQQIAARRRPIRSSAPDRGVAALHPDGTVQFNLACYEAQLGNLDRAKANLKRATSIDTRFSEMALEDPDLEPLWASLVTDFKPGPTAPRIDESTLKN